MLDVQPALLSQTGGSARVSLAVSIASLQIAVVCRRVHGWVMIMQRRRAGLCHT
jgi:hypothetical protein